ILIRLSGDEVLLLHLGMSGSVRIHHKPPQLAKHDHVMVEMAPDATGQPAFVVFRDPRRFGWIDLFLAAAESQH
ncbi:MAG: DNA-formamidopyrimidine glycosylase family protein, partial [Candidatus Puniceispirillum sp.]